MDVSSCTEIVLNCIYRIESYIIKLFQVVFIFGPAAALAVEKIKDEDGVRKRKRRKRRRRRRKRA